jgi:hypothetical protein
MRSSVIVLGACSILVAGMPARAQSAPACDVNDTTQQWDFLGQIRVGGKGVPNLNGRYTKTIVHANEDCQTALNDQALNFAYSEPPSPGAVVSSTAYLWKWDGTGCLDFGSGWPFATAASSLLTHNCTGGKICKIGGNEVCHSFPSGDVTK